MANIKIDLAGRILEADSYSFSMKDRLSYVPFMNGNIKPAIVGKLPLEIKVTGLIPQSQQSQFISAMTPLVAVAGQSLKIDNFTYSVTLDRFELKSCDDSAFLRYELLMHK